MTLYEELKARGLVAQITDDEIKDFALISKKLNDISLAVDALNLWVDKTTSENNINIKLLNEEMQKLNQ